jgi:hypothetical protein
MNKKIFVYVCKDQPKHPEKNDWTENETIKKDLRLKI